MNNSLVELTELIVKGIANDSESVSVKEFESDDDNVVLIEVMVSGDDMARVIGRGGVVANSIRTLVQADAYVDGKQKVFINIDSI